MIRTFAGVLALLIPLVIEAAPGDIRTYCDRIGGQSYQLTLQCVRSEEQAQERVGKLTVGQRIMDYCNRITTSWSLLETCIKSEQEAKRQLGR